MHNHEPEGYACPFCRLVAGMDTERSGQEDVVYRANGTTAFVSPKWWASNPAHVIVVPDRHVENLYDAPTNLLGAVYATAREIALALRGTYGCAGTSTRQHNEPAGGQDVWHLHAHVFPRYPGDDLDRSDALTRWVTAEERAPYAARLHGYLHGLEERRLHP